MGDVAEWFQAQVCGTCLRGFDSHRHPKDKPEWDSG